ncbi:hypothetical protein A1O3_01840 [Capronia epimyces CBS 606.96]|uniref:Uncharacterized protein n=1 Tax=Capronia epimyces CBS 606.96 TaxID=1182542 RepID=W9YHN3_9EURO|nr:uncharacterized protein A1O3_01840 [Capronia epimyces CBS 606.96]EXJ88776.1 hypothetical protein A1O3_01840 [Capronia epimyces CBS 606.96]
MPTILTPQGWVKVAPVVQKKRPAKSDPAEAFKGTLAYFSCQQLPSKTQDSYNRTQFPYDLSASPEKLKRQGLAQTQAKIGGKNRTVSTPQPQPGFQVDGDEDWDGVIDRRSHSTRSSTRSISPPPKSARSQRSSNPRPAHRSHSPSPSHRTSSRNQPVESVPPPVIVYHTPSAPHPSGPRRSPETRYHNYYPAGGIEHPPPPTSARSMSYSWYNATTPLNL